MKLEGNEVEIGSYLVVLSGGCFYDMHPELPYFGRTMPPLGVPLRVTAKRLIGRVNILSFRDDDGIYHGAFEVGHCGHPLSFYYRWPTTIELCEKFKVGSFALNDGVLHIFPVEGSGLEQLKKALSFDLPPSSVDILGRRHYYYNPNTNRPSVGPLDFNDSISTWRHFITNQCGYRHYPCVSTIDYNPKPLTEQPRSLGATNTTNKYIVGCDPYQESSSLISPEVVPVKYKIGDRFTCNHTEYILVQVDSHLVCMINLGNGNRYANPVKVSDANNILPSEIPDLNIFTPKK